MLTEMFAGFVVERLDGLWCSPLMVFAPSLTPLFESVLIHLFSQVSFGLHVEKVWSIGLAEWVSHGFKSLGLFQESSNLSLPLVSHDGIVLVMKMKESHEPVPE